MGLKKKTKVAIKDAIIRSVEISYLREYVRLEIHVMKYRNIYKYDACVVNCIENAVVSGLFDGFDKKSDLYKEYRADIVALYNRLHADIVRFKLYDKIAKMKNIELKNELADRRVRGVSYDDYLQSEYWVELKEEVFKIHGKKCTACEVDRNIQCHHLSYEYLGMMDIERHCIVPLCRECHKKEHGKF